MTIDSRGRRAGQEFRRAIDDVRSSSPDRGAIARFERIRVRKQRNRRIGATLLATGVTVAAIVFVGRVFGPVDRGTPAARPCRVVSSSTGTGTLRDNAPIGTRRDRTARVCGTCNSARRARCGSRTGIGS